MKNEIHNPIMSSDERSIIEKRFQMLIIPDEAEDTTELKITFLSSLVPAPTMLQKLKKGLSYWFSCQIYAGVHSRWRDPYTLTLDRVLTKAQVEHALKVIRI